MHFIDYTLPKELIAKKPASPRDCSKIMIYDSGSDSVSFDIFLNLDKYLPEKSLLVFNKTKVLPARLHLQKESGGKAEILLLLNEKNSEKLRAISDRKLEVGTKLFYKKKELFFINKQEEQFFFLEPLFDVKKLEELLLKIGETPLPPYMGKNALSEKNARKKYQAIFAKEIGSIAAPTASLHFTDRLLKKLTRKGIKKTEILLHVGMGTFSPISEDNFKEKKLHREYYEVSENSLRQIRDAKEKGFKIIPVGTTSVRTLESVAKNNYKKLNGETDLFIYPPYNFDLTDCLITNFHVPKSSLILLVEAFLRHKKSKKTAKDLYEIAIEEKMRFFSFGDAMLIK